MEPLSFCDWPGHTAMVLFCGGCNLRCPTCHNGQIAWKPDTLPSQSRPRILTMLAERKRWLDGIVITGGEPTCVKNLNLLLEDLSRIGLPLKVDSNGMKPGVVEALLASGLVDQFFIDVKGPYHLYPQLTGQGVSEDQARANLEHIFAMARTHPQAFVFRLTHVPLLTNEDVALARSYPPDGFKLRIQKYQEPRRTYA